jgi:hypothetical protein
MFAGRKLLISTKHHKERVIAPLLEKELGVICIVPDTIDTDILGTFTGEIERTDDPLTTARNKCLMAMAHHTCDLAIASEGSFGAHPSIPFLSADDEWVLLVDKRNGLEIWAREVSTQTNFNGELIQTEEQLWTFADKVLFPSHGLIIRKTKEDVSGVVKGIVDKSILLETFQSFVRENGSAYIETDMRALYNPTRMSVIEKATQSLVAKLQSKCPECATPGFSITSSRTGLPCAWCGFPTPSVLSYHYTCIKCSYTREEMFPNHKTTEDPMYCIRCNP